MPPRPGALDPVSEQVQTTLFRALAVLRLVVAVYAVVLNASRWHEFAHPLAGWVVVAVIVAWTLFVTWGYDAPHRRRLPLLVADVAVAAATLLATPYVESEQMLARHASTLPSFWVMAAVLAWAVARGWAGGLAAAVVVSLLDLSVRTVRNGTTWGNIFLLLLAAGVVGYSVSLVREATEARAEAERLAARLEERARLARAVHDGVLQVLALVQRRGRELGGEAAELGRMAGEQEVALRALVQGGATQARSAVVGAADGTADLGESLAELQSTAVTVAAPAQPVRLPADVAREVVLVVRACLDNVRRHVGEDAAAWVLLEDLGDRVVVSVRDEGPGVTEERLAQAEGEGRLGVSQSIRGRMVDLGGSAELVSRPGQGSEWELSVPTAR
jgi:signal transduction histidine kinase